MERSKLYSRLWIYLYVTIVISPVIITLLVTVGVVPQVSQWNQIIKLSHIALSITAVVVIIRSVLSVIKIATMIENTYISNIHKLEPRAHSKAISIFHMLKRLQRNLKIIGLENQILYDTSLAIHTSSSLKELLDTLLGRLRTHLGGDFALVFLLEGKYLKLENTNNIDKEKLSKLSFRIGEGIEGEALYKDRVIISSDINKDPRYIKSVEGCNSQVTIPLKVYNEMLGVLVLGSYNKNNFREKEVALLKTISSEIALAINGAKLTEQLRNEKTLVDTLFNITQKISSSIDIDTVMQNGLKSINEISKATSCSLMLLDEEDELLKIKAATGLSKESIENIMLKKGEGIAGKAFSENSTLYTEDLPNEPQFKLIENQKEAFEKLYAIPINTTEKSIGVVNIATNENLTNDSLEMLQAITTQLGKSLENALLHQSVEILATKDNLTGFYNNRYFHQALENEIARARRYKRSLTLVTLDIDDFKVYNDTYGHLVGDYVLETISTLLQNGTRDSDILCRYGGDELFVILPETDSQNAAHVMERIISAVASRNFNFSENELDIINENEDYHSKGAQGDISLIGQVANWFSINKNNVLNLKKSQDLQVTVSVGVCSLDELKGMEKLEIVKQKQELIKRADEAMLQAKQKGKNQILQYKDIA